jgi:glycine oxidase
VKKSYDVVIVGGGIIGLSCAYYLARHQKRVAVLERGRVAREASWAGGGILTPIHLADYPEPLARLSVLSMGLYPDFVQEVHEASQLDPEFVPSGVLMPLFDDEDEKHAKKLVAWKAKHDQPAEKLSAREACAMEPALNDRIRGAVLLPDISQVRNNRLCRALELALRRRGVDLFEGTPCLSIRGPSVETPDGPLSAGHVVIATGAWVKELAPVPVKPVKGQMILSESAPGFLRRIIISKDQYIIPRLDGRLVIGSTVEEVGFNKTVTMEGVTFLAQRAAEMVPATKQFPMLASWAGLRPGSADRIPFIAPHPEEKRVFVAAGHFRNGILLAPATGTMIASMVLGSPSPIDPSPFGLRR